MSAIESRISNHLRPIAQWSQTRCDKSALNHAYCRFGAGATAYSIAGARLIGIDKK
jgi:hypothetical protein